MRRLARLAFVVRADRLCCFMPGPAFTFPVAVILKRFLTDDLVFALGISISLFHRARQIGRRSRPGMPIQARARDKGRVCSGARGVGQGRKAETCYLTVSITNAHRSVWNAPGPNCLAIAAAEAAVAASRPVGSSASISARIGVP